MALGVRFTLHGDRMRLPVGRSTSLVACSVIHAVPSTTLVDRARSIAVDITMLDVEILVRDAGQWLRQGR
jgi:hypothetical protein